MLTIKDSESLKQVTDNIVLGTPSLDRSQIIFSGKNNVLYVEDGVSLVSSTIRFNGNGALVVLGKSRHQYKADITVNNNCTAVFGRNVYFNGKLNAIISEERTIVVGDDVLLSFGIWMRTADPHLVYDADSHTRINLSRDIVVGDHVWIGQSAMLLKGTTIGSGSIVGAMSVVAGKKIPSNSSWAGNPVKPIKDGIFWEGSCVHTWTSEKTQQSMELKTDEYLYRQDRFTLPPDLVVAPNSLPAQDRLAHYLAIGFDEARHNRLAISSNPA